MALELMMMSHNQLEALQRVRGDFPEVHISEESTYKHDKQRLRDLNIGRYGVFLSAESPEELTAFAAAMENKREEIRRQERESEAQDLLETAYEL